MTPQELERHQQYITGSKVASIIGLPDAFVSKYTLFSCMRGRTAWPEDVNKQDLFLAGQCAELAMSEYCRLKWGWDLRPGPPGGMFHPRYPFIYGLADRLRMGKGGLDQIIEFKNVGEWARSEWENGPPQKYIAQCVLYTLIYDLPATIVCCIGGSDYQVFPIDRDAKIENFILTECIQFWQDLQAGNWPAPDGHETTTATIREQFQTHSAEMIHADSDFIAAAVQYEQGRRLEKQGKGQKEEAGNKLKARIGHALGGEFWGGSATWKETKPKIMQFDGDRFQADHPDLFKKYQKLPDPTRVLRVTVREGVLNQYAK